MTTQPELALLQVAFGIVIDEANAEIANADEHVEKWRNDSSIAPELVEGTVGYGRGIRFVKDRIKAFLDSEADRVEPEPTPTVVTVEPTPVPKPVPAPQPKKVEAPKPKAADAIVWVDDEDVLTEADILREKIAKLTPFLKAKPGKFALLAEGMHRWSGASHIKGVTISQRAAGRDDEGKPLFDIFVKWGK